MSRGRHEGGRNCPWPARGQPAPQGEGLATRKAELTCQAFWGVMGREEQQEGKTSAPEGVMGRGGAAGGEDSSIGGAAAGEEDL